MENVIPTHGIAIESIFFPNLAAALVIGIDRDVVNRYLGLR